MDRAERRVANPEDGRHPLGADPEVPHIEQELLARILLDREFFREVDDLEVVRMDFEPAGRSLVCEDFAADDDGRLDESFHGGSECLRGNGVPGDCDLDDARRVPHDDERFPPDGPCSVDPASQLDRLAGVASLQDFRDGDHEPGSHSAGSRLPFLGRKRQ